MLPVGFKMMGIYKIAINTIIMYLHTLAVRKFIQLLSTQRNKGVTKSNYWFAFRYLQETPRLQLPAR